MWNRARIFWILLALGSSVALSQIEVLFFLNEEQWESIQGNIEEIKERLQEKEKVVIRNISDSKALFLADFLAKNNPRGLILVGHSIGARLGTSLFSDAKGFPLAELLCLPLPARLSKVTILACMTDYYEDRLKSIERYIQSTFLRPLSLTHAKENICKSNTEFANALEQMLADSTEEFSCAEEACGDSCDNPGEKKLVDIEDLGTLPCTKSQPKRSLPGQVKLQLIGETPAFCVAYGEEKPIACFWLGQPGYADRMVQSVRKSLLVDRMRVMVRPESAASHLKFRVADKIWIFRSITDPSAGDCLFRVMPEHQTPRLPAG